MLTSECSLSMNKHKPAPRHSPKLFEKSVAHLSLGHTHAQFSFQQTALCSVPPTLKQLLISRNNRTVVPKRVRSAVVRGAEQTSSFGVSCLSLALLLKQDQHKPTSLAGLTDVAFKSSITSTPERARRGFLCRVC